MSESALEHIRERTPTEKPASNRSVAPDGMGLSRLRRALQNWLRNLTIALTRWAAEFAAAEFLSPEMSFDPVTAGFGGGMGIRTPDLLIANETLYQLSYTPNLIDFSELHDNLRNKKDACLYRQREMKATWHL
jgi:hypothetical protein